MIRGIRGATTVEENNTGSIIEATLEVMKQIQDKNNVVPEDISHIMITMTDDLNATFPARALRQLDGYQFVPVMCAQEISVPDGLKKCIRLMVTVNTAKRSDDIHHVYLKDAVKLRPDLALTNKQESR
ncbi:chorismate mutase [Salipaludibacillus aurantiacus]|uniref:chorismate mutase n=1 Tax=Salipaludibacillus aurantiacus TaxID=1601833 RepID=A0A1H9P7Q9_9BACI|nr:chorismate mutase [Salipaludibacillus aurantiacus]SER44248.1 chorismate mutase [Salipaludibacillus aurantiacus]